MDDVDWAYSSTRGPSLPYLHTGGFRPQTNDGAKWEFSLKTTPEEPLWKLSGWGPHLEDASQVILFIGVRAFLVVVLRCHLHTDSQWCCAYRLGSRRLSSIRVLVWRPLLILVFTSSAPSLFASYWGGAVLRRCHLHLWGRWLPPWIDALVLCTSLRRWIQLNITNMPFCLNALIGFSRTQSRQWAMTCWAIWLHAIGAGPGSVRNCFLT